MKNTNDNLLEELNPLQEDIRQKAYELLTQGYSRFEICGAISLLMDGAIRAAFVQHNISKDND